jgi:cellulose synthase/poly-beta-1,6-N-acetylglucosamine synthase-like glycosyltransferase
MYSVAFTGWIIVQILAGFQLVLPFLQFISYKLFGRRNPSATKVSAEPDYGIIVTAYEQTHTLKAAIASLLKLNYSNYLIYIVADKCDVSNLHFADERVILLRPPQTLGSNTRSHFYAIQRFKRDHTYMTIIDSDNLVEPEYLNQLNLYFAQGFEAVQGIRKAKNLDTIYACLDAVQDMYYNFYDREVLYRIGSSATLAGSGMAFTTRLYRDTLEHLDITGAGFDKVLQYEILRSGKRIAHAPGAVVYDEKTSKSDQLVKQRARWFNTWFRYAGLGFKLLGRGILHLNWNQAAFGLMFVRPPLFLVFLTCFLMMTANLFIDLSMVFWWLGAFGLFVVALFIALVHFRADRRIYRSLAGIPLFIFYQVLSLLKVRKANKYSVATQHYHASEIEEVKS